MKKGICALFICLFVMGALPVFAEMRLTTPDGKIVILRDNGTWIYEASPTDNTRQPAMIKFKNSTALILDVDVSYHFNGTYTKMSKDNITAGKSHTFTIPATATLFSGGGGHYEYCISVKSGGKNPYTWGYNNKDVKPGETRSWKVTGTIFNPKFEQE